VAVTIPPDTRALGTGNPPVDMDDVADVLNNAGIGYFVEDTSWSGGADPTGSADSTSAINAAVAACPRGGTVYGRPGALYKTSGPIEMWPQVTLDLGHSSHIDASSSCIQPSASFSGASVILMVDQATGGFPVISNQQRIRGVTLDGSNLTGNTIDGIQAQGYVHGVILEGVQIRYMPNHGIAAASNGSGVPYSWRGTQVAANTCSGHGFSIVMTDCTWIDLEAIGNGLNGFNLSGSPANSTFSSCRAEFNGSAHVTTQGNGFSLSGAWGEGTGSGGCLFTGCSTDGNWGAGAAVTATGDVPVIFDPLMLRRDGYGDSGAYQSGLCIQAAGIPVTVGVIGVFPGIALTLLAESPVYGVYCHGSTYFSLGGGWVHAATTPISTGSNTVCRIGPNIGRATGPTTSPTFSYDNPWGTDSGSTFTAALSANDQTGIAVAAASSVTNTSNPLFQATSGTSGSDILLKATYQAAAHSLFQALVSGELQWGGGTSAVDTDLYRNSAGVLKTDGSLIVNTGLGVGASAPAGPAVSVAGLTGATAGCRLAGAIASGTAPLSGTFATGDVIIVLTGSVIICTAGGSPGTWVVA
jgi:hypothetical protein